MRFCKLLGLVLIFSSQMAQAYFSTLDTADPVAPSNYKLSLAPQFIVTERDGANLVTRLDTGINEESSVRGVIGFGHVDFQAGAFYKWNPIPDIEGQPGISLMGGLLYASDEDGGELSARIHPIISKKVEVDFALFNPYVSIPFGVTSIDGDTEFPIQLTVGSEFTPTDLKNFQFVAEAGFNVSKAFTYITFGVSVLFDEDGKLKDHF